MSGRLDFEYGFKSNTAQPIEPDAPMRVYFLGDFTGSRSAIEFNTNNKIVKIDVDNFDQVMTKLSPSVDLPFGQQLTFNELEDFHPEQLFDGPIFKNLRRLKKELANSATAEKAAQEIITYFQLGTQSELNAVDNNSASEPSGAESNDAMIERLLGQKPSAPIAASTEKEQAAGHIDAFLANLLSPHIIQDAKPEHQSLTLLIDNAIEELMNRILHAADFQSLESAWLSVRDVIFNEEYAEPNQQFYVVNTSIESLKEALSGDLGFMTKLSQHIKGTDTDTYDVLIGNYHFSASDTDITTLNYLASLAETLKCQLVSAADSGLVDADETSLWQEFRKTPQAHYVALTYPQILLRIPYGKQLDEVDGFTYEEFRQPHEHHQLLWGNAAFACARLMLRQYHAQLPYNTTITHRPAFTYVDSGEQKLYPCAELLLSEQQLIAIRQQGIMPFASFRNKNSIRLFGDEIRAVNNA